MWLADDGKPPIHLAHLTPQLASQVTQVWAVHIDTFRTTQQVIQMLPPAEEPDFDPPLHPSPEKRPRLEQAHNQLHYANVNSFGRQVIDSYWTRKSEVYIFVETHLDPQKHEQTCQYYTIRGRTAFGVPAWPNEDNSGTHGGILILGGHRKRALNPHGPFTVLRSLDGFSRASAEYVPIAYICHRGPIHDTGHYTLPSLSADAICCGLLMMDARHLHSSNVPM